MKRTLAIFLALLMLLSMTACGENGKKPENDQKTEQTTEQTSEPAETFYHTQFDERLQRKLLGSNKEIEIKRDDDSSEAHTEIIEIDTDGYYFVELQAREDCVGDEEFKLISSLPCFTAESNGIIDFPNDDTERSMSNLYCSLVELAAGEYTITTNSKYCRFRVSPLEVVDLVGTTFEPDHIYACNVYEKKSVQFTGSPKGRYCYEGWAVDIYMRDVALQDNGDSYDITFKDDTTLTVIDMRFVTPMGQLDFWK